MTPIVIDASSVLAVALAEIAQQRSDQLLDRIAQRGVIVPAIFPVEVANSLDAARRRGRLDAVLADGFLATLAILPIVIRPSRMLGQMVALRALAQAHSLTAYDASYLAVALDEGLELFTLDKALERAARAAGVPVSQP